MDYEEGRKTEMPKLCLWQSIVLFKLVLTCYESASASSFFPRFLDLSSVFADDDAREELEAAIARGDTAKAVSLLREVGEEEKSAAVQEVLLLAIKEGNIEEMKSLIQNENASINSDAVEAAAVSPKLADVFQAFLDVGWRPNSNLGHTGTPLMQVIEHIDAVKWLLDHGADPNYGQSGMTRPLDAAVLRSSPEVVKFMIERGALMKNRNGLKTAAYWGKLDMIETLLEAGADVNEVPEYEDMLESEVRQGLGPALHYAARNGQLDAVKLLLDRGANRDIKDSLGKTAVEVAEESEQKEVAEYLRAL